MSDPAYDDLMLVCTDRGTHPRTVLARLRFTADVAPGEPVHGLRGQALADFDGPVIVEDLTHLRRVARGQWDALAAESQASGGRAVAAGWPVPPVAHQGATRVGTSWRFVCPRCRRDVRLSAAELRRRAELWPARDVDLSLRGM